MPDDIVTFEHFQVARRDDGGLFELGRGAMGVTYKAYDTRLDGFVALKVINPGFLNDEIGRERFLREARAAAHLDHPNVAAIFHRGQQGDTYFYAMQFIEGETLDAYVRRRGPLPVPLALRLILQAAQGLAAANARGLIHRDVKPANLMLVHLDPDSGVDGGVGSTANEPGEEDLLVKVIDFGLAKVVLDEKAGPNLSLTGEGPIGTPYYMSPEQIDASNGDVDARTDIYSLGVTLWYLLTGQPPFVGTQFQVFRQHIGAPPPLAQLPVNVPENVRALLGRMMAKSPTDRPTATRDLINQIRELLRGSLAPAAETALPSAVAAQVPSTAAVASVLSTSSAHTLPAPPPTPVPPPPPAVPSYAQAKVPPAGVNPAGTHRPAAVPAAPPLPAYPPPPSYPVPPPPAYQPYPPPPVAPARAGHGREWLIFGTVLVGALLLGGIPLGIYIARSGHDGGANSTPVASATPSPSAAAQATDSTGAAPAASPGRSVSAAASAANTSPNPGGPRTLNVPGQYTTVQLALNAAHSGDTVRVGAGTWKEKLQFHEGIRLIGAGVDQTTVSTDGTGEALDVKGCQSGTISGITFEHTGMNPANEVDYVVWFHNSGVRLRECRIRNSGSVGLSCEEGDHSIVEDCEFIGNRNVGLRAMGAGTAPTFRGNHAHENGTTGISFSKGAAGLAENNTSEDNVEFGFSVMDEKTAPALNGNTVRGNTYSGFTYQKGAGGTAQDNVVEHNKEAGFRVADKGSAPVFTSNRVRENGMSGFIFLDGAGGAMESNTSDANTGAGILIKSAGTIPIIKKNHLTGNQLQGMYFNEAALGTALSNVITGNKEGGIVVTGKGTGPTLRENQVNENGKDGIAFLEGAGGLAEGNTVQNNERYGIGTFGAGTAPTLGANNVSQNKSQDLFTENGATPKRGGKGFDGFFK